MWSSARESLMVMVRKLSRAEGNHSEVGWSEIPPWTVAKTFSAFWTTFPPPRGLPETPRRMSRPMKREISRVAPVRFTRSRSVELTMVGATLVGTVGSNARGTNPPPREGEGADAGGVEGGLLGEMDRAGLPLIHGHRMVQPPDARGEGAEEH